MNENMRFGLSDSAVSDIRDTLTNPSGTFEVPVHNKTFATEPFTQDEADMFVSQLNSLLIGLNSAQLGKIIEDRSSTLARVATHAKQELDSKVFGGINAGDNEIGFSVLRPGHIRSDPNSGNPENDWYFDPGTTGYVDWIGDGGANNFTIGEDEVVSVFAFADQDVTTQVSGLNIDQFGRNMDMLPQDLNDMRLRDNETQQHVQELPTLVATDNDDVHCRLRYDRQAESQPRFYGVTFGIGAFLNQEDY